MERTSEKKAYERPEVLAAGESLVCEGACGKCGGCGELVRRC